MNVLFLGYGPIASRFIDLSLENGALENANILTSQVITKFPSNTNAIEKFNISLLKDTDVIINSWKSISNEKSQRRNLLQEIAKNKSNSTTFLNLSSVAVYGEANKIRYEDSETSPLSEYGIEKLKIEKYLECIQMFGTINLRISNVFGDSRFFDFINKLVESYLTQKPLAISDPSETYRDFISINKVSNVLNELVLRKMDFNTKANFSLNLCQGESLSLSHVISLFESLINNRVIFKESGRILNEIKTSKVSNSKLKNYVHWDETSASDEISSYFRSRIFIDG